MKKMYRLLTLVMAFLIGISQVAWAGSTQVDALIEKLVDKGILTKSESIALKSEIAQDEKLYRAEGLKQDLPDWVKNTKLKGDLRIRSQYERKKNDSEARTRARIRYRFGVESDVVKNVKVAAGLASGSSDPRSTNQTLENTFETPDIRLDYAYGQYAPNEKLKIIGGKFPFKDYLWNTTDMLWDGDITSNGASVHYDHKFHEKLASFLNGGVWVIDEKGKTDATDPFMTYGQAGLAWTEGKFSSKVAGTVYSFDGVKGTTLDSTASTNTLAGSVLKNDYDSFGGSIEIAAKKLFGGLPLNIDDKIAVFGDYINNIDPEDNDTGWAAGMQIGHDKVNGKGQWQAKYQYVVLAKDAFPDAFPDSDRLGGATDLKGKEVIFEYGINKNIILGFDYYRTERLTTTENPETLVQADLLFKF